MCVFGDSVFCTVIEYIFFQFGRRQWRHFYICTYTHIPFDFIALLLWSPPVATQFSVVRAPPVATLVISFYFIASFLWAPPVATLLHTHFI